MGLGQDIWQGHGRGQPRFRDQLGRRVPLRRLVRNGPRAIGTGLSRKLLGKRPARPWISYDAADALGRHLGDNSRVLEFGSGMSTAWYAARAGDVLSIERDAEWFAEVSSRLATLVNAELRLCASREAYLAIEDDRQFDLIMIDGAWRDDCARLATQHLAPGGVIYCDNTDKQGGTSGDLTEARRLLIAFAEERNLPWTEITDFAPTQFFVERALWVGPNAPR
ncbi:class I SAM-dependent methyltransferase [Qipengyuania sp. XHP0211]|uniref:class I SAM-dependent methyltransferase n=1 Tax=Qipengyuania sp. XHP0211 TaxID=3038079 RepID=UPI00241BE8E9|nr:class I SAM-dependent methyltransferase [Qipengyuania sp. XHP0211]MDG5750987.1 class I SAM-dependent methyltransferase [Qipengyuania sp. XHP0211]